MKCVLSCFILILLSVSNAKDALETNNNLRSHSKIELTSYKKLLSRKTMKLNVNTSYSTDEIKQNYKHSHNKREKVDDILDRLLEEYKQSVKAKTLEKLKKKNKSKIIEYNDDSLKKNGTNMFKRPLQKQKENGKKINDAPHGDLKSKNNDKPSKWKTTIIKFRGDKLKLIYNSKVDLNAIERILEIIDKSSDTKKPTSLKDDEYKGMIRKDDIIVINEKLILWFSVTALNNGRVIKTGGGLLAGAWEIILNNEGRISLKNLNRNLYAQNMLLAGSAPGSKLSGANVYGMYSSNNVVWGIERAVDVREAEISGKQIVTIDKGAYSNEDGIFVAFEGTITNSNTNSGIESITDTDPRYGKIGKTIYKLIYRIPANKPELIQEVQIKVKENNFGPISNVVLALALPAYKSDKIVYASTPELIPINKELSLNNVSINKYFRNTCVKEVFFYDVENKSQNNIQSVAITPPGEGRIACVGTPQNNISFVCGYPNPDYIPKTIVEEFLLEITTQKLDKKSSFYSINHKLFNDKEKTITLKTGEQLIMIMRYKFIDTTGAVKLQ